MLHIHTVNTSTTTDGEHLHEITTRSAGAHTHTVSGNTDALGGHSHNTPYKYPYLSSYATTLCGHAKDQNWVFGQVGDEINAAGAHIHTINGTAASSGSHTHTITSKQSDSHYHTIHTDTDEPSNTKTSLFGNGQSGNLQPYITVYMFKRTK